MTTNLLQRGMLGLFLLMMTHAATGQEGGAPWPVLKTYRGKYLERVAMPLGGIGTGTVSLGGRGDLRDWELMNRGALGYLPAFKFVPPSICNGPFFALWYREPGKDAMIRVLEGPVPAGEYEGDWGADAANAGFPRFEETVFSAAYPLAGVEFIHRDVPLEVRLEAFNPLVMGDADRSGIPVAVLRYVLTNPADHPIEAAVCGMVPNYIGTDGWTGEPEGNRNLFRTGKGLQGVYMYSEGVDELDVNGGTMALTTTATEGVTCRTSWAALPWNWTFREFWDDLIADGALTDHPGTMVPARGSPDQGEDGTGSRDGAGPVSTPPATLAAKMTLAPGESRRVTFLLTWHFPNRRAWDLGTGYADSRSADYGGPEIVGNYYTTLYRDAWDVAERTVSGLEELEKETVKFVSALVHSDIPAVIREAALFNLNNLRSQTMFRTADGMPFGFEGTGSVGGTRTGGDRSSGWGFGTCFHVWHYESAVPFLFGDLSLKFREVEFMHATGEDGGMSFRVGLPLETRARNYRHRAADGQMGALVKMYRDWQQSGDDTKLREMWPMIKKAMAYAWTGPWDRDGDGVMEGEQHNTMDVAYHGPNPQMAAWYLAALRSSEEMALYLGDDAFAAECRALYERGRSWTDSNLFNGDYYEQQIPPGMSTEAQLGKGCLVDQLAGQYLAHTAGLGYVLDPDHVRTTLRSIMKYNLVENFNDHFNTFRSFGLGDETGLVMAGYPRGGLPELPFPYYTEVMTGFEYSTAAHMLYEGQTEAGVRVFEAVRDRYDGYKRNPFNEGEYGHRYARAMASWAGIPAWTGFSYSAVNRSMAFNPGEGKFFWSNGYLYGTVEIRSGGNQKTVVLTCLNGDLHLDAFGLNGYGSVPFPEGRVFAPDLPVKFSVPRSVNAMALSPEHTP